jgi:hypothetical protein
MLLPKEFRLFRMYPSKESITVKTEIMAKIPMVIPNSERNVRNLFPLSEPKANEKLSIINLVKSIFPRIEK